MEGYGAAGESAAGNRTGLNQWDRPAHTLEGKQRTVVSGGKLPQQQRRLTLALGASTAEQVDHRLQRALCQHLALDVLRGVHQVAQHTNRLVAHPQVLRPQQLGMVVVVGGGAGEGRIRISHCRHAKRICNMIEAPACSYTSPPSSQSIHPPCKGPSHTLTHTHTHLDQHWQPPALHDLLLVLLVLERQRAQRPRPSALHLEVPRLQQRHQRRDAALRAHAVLLQLCIVGGKVRGLE